MMDAVNDTTVESVVIMSSAQVGKTEILNNIIGYHVHLDPSPILLLQPTLEMAEAWSKDRLAPMLRDTETLRGLVKDPRSRDSGNTLLYKRFPGGHITMAGANSPASLASRPIRIVLGDEVDRYPVSAGTEGDPVSLAK
jgi:phage terminase large subunit GpA-like protein